MELNPWANVLLFEALYIAGFYPTRHHIYRVLILAAEIYTAAQVYLTLEVTDPVTGSYMVGVVMACHFTFTTYLLCAEGTLPDHWRRVRDEVRPGAESGGLDNPPSSFPLTEKLWWMLDIAYNPRMVGWVQEPRDHLPPHPPPSRRAFLWRTLLKFAVDAFLVSDLLTLVLGRTLAFDSRMHDPTDGPEAYLAAVPFLRRVPYALAYCVMTAAFISISHNLAALVCVGLGRSSPTLWPDLLGHWGDAYTIRRFWGKTWHQMLRPMFTGLGKLVANKVLKFPRGTNRSSYTQLYVAFLLSGAIHSSAEFMLQRRLVYRSFTFFLLQAVAITFEDAVIYTAKRFLFSRGTELKPGKADESWAEVVLRGGGYCWVTLWFCLTLPAWIDETSATGFNNTDIRPIAQFILDARKRWV